MLPEGSAQEMQRHGKYLANKRSILENRFLSQRAKNRLMGMALMEKVAAGTEAKISKHGVVIYTLANGGKICDTGKSISFSDGARDTALAYMAAKWGVRSRRVDRASGQTVFVLANGQSFSQEADRNVFERPKMDSRKMERSMGMGRWASGRDPGL